MKRILLSLMVLVIALTCVAAVSASSDINQTVDGGIISDVSDAVPMDDIAEIDNEIVVDDADNGIDHIDDVDNGIDHIDDVDDISIHNSVDEKALGADSPADVNNGQSKLKLVKDVVIPDVKVTPTVVDTGDKIHDAAVYYSAYYTAYKDYFKSYAAPLEALSALIYQSYNEEDTVRMVSEVYWMDVNANMVGVKAYSRGLCDIRARIAFASLYGVDVFI